MLDTWHTAWWPLWVDVQIVVSVLVPRFQMGDDVALRQVGDGGVLTGLSAVAYSIRTIFNPTSSPRLQFLFPFDDP